jgi:Zn finger protein HypA/HybF involved in hydrogenase expression
VPALSAPLLGEAAAPRRLALLAVRASGGGGAEVSDPIIDKEPRCWRCEKKLFEEAARPWKKVCPRCHATNCSPPLDKARIIAATE